MSEQQQPRVAVITGASAGVGLAAAKTLAAKGWRIIGTGRDAGRSVAAEAEIRAVAADGVQVDMVRADFSLLADTARAADEIAALTPRIDVLVNNAGGLAPAFEITSEGNEVTFAGNHLGPFLLTKKLMPQLRAAAADSAPGEVRIVNTSSDGHAYARFNWDDLQMVNNYTTGGAYCLAKLGNILFTRELARRFGSEGIIAHSLHPGSVSSNFHSHANEEMKRNMATIQQNWVTSEEASETVVWLAESDEAAQTNGGYFYQCKPEPAAPQALDDDAALRLWEESEKLVAKAGF